MNTAEILLIALALAMDAFAVSITCGICSQRITLKNVLKVALFFGGFQALMPLAGWFIGSVLSFDMSMADHWIAFGLLALIGGKMIVESREESEECKNYFRLPTLTMAAIATSIDALAAGFSITLLGGSIMFLAASAGIIAFIMSFIGVEVGNRHGHLFEKNIELIGGLVLIGIGAKILIEHLFFIPH